MVLFNNLKLTNMSTITHINITAIMHSHVEEIIFRAKRLNKFLDNLCEDSLKEQHEFNNMFINKIEEDLKAIKIANDELLTL